MKEAAENNRPTATTKNGLTSTLFSSKYRHILAIMGADKTRKSGSKATNQVSGTLKLKTLTLTYLLINKFIELPTCKLDRKKNTVNVKSIIIPNILLLFIEEHFFTYMIHKTTITNTKKHKK